MPNKIPTMSILDTDLYKLTMQQAVLEHFPNAQAVYKFTHRDAPRVSFTRECVDAFRASIVDFSTLRLTPSERTWLAQKCPSFKASYLDYLSSFQFDASQVNIDFIPESKNLGNNSQGHSNGDVASSKQRGQIDITITGPWHEAIMWEVPLMARLSEVYFTIVDTDWDYTAQDDKAYHKSRTLLSSNIVFSEFGTRRRRSYKTQDIVIASIVKAERDYITQLNEGDREKKGKFMGTSNVHLAHKYDVTPIGTVAHEWFMGIASLLSYPSANVTALDLWHKTYSTGPLVALTDTFSTDVFWKDFTSPRSLSLRLPYVFTALRQDSGDPFVYAPKAVQMYKQLSATVASSSDKKGSKQNGDDDATHKMDEIDYRKKSIVYSDSLNVEKALKLKEQCDELGIGCSFGIGTSLTNDFTSTSSNHAEKSPALNMVIKLHEIDGRPCVKISDEIMKNTGDPKTVKAVKEIYGIPIQT